MSVCVCVCSRRQKQSCISPSLTCSLYFIHVFVEKPYISKRKVEGNVFYYCSSNRLRVEQHLSSFGNRTFRINTGLCDFVKHHRPLVNKVTSPHLAHTEAASICLFCPGGTHFQLWAVPSSAPHFLQGQEILMSMIKKKKKKRKEKHREGLLWSLLFILKRWVGERSAETQQALLGCVSR